MCLTHMLSVYDIRCDILEFLFKFYLRFSRAGCEAISGFGGSKNIWNKSSRTLVKQCKQIYFLIFQIEMHSKI